jgi:excinuclease ABC subunit C
MRAMTAFDPQSFVSRLSGAPGVYRMLNEKGEVLYVGKARNLRKRVGSYFVRRTASPRTHHMLRQVANIEITVTHTEIEALLLENNLIKNLKPRYNIQLRDDKSYPYILLTNHPFPRLAFYRGARREPGRYFGPYPSASSVRESLNLLQKVFPIRQCEDSVFRNRSRPCLQYQIKRCTAPCVGYISSEAYAEDVRHAALFLEGQSKAVIGEMIRRMDAAAAALDYETAARYRDRIAALRRIQERQAISGDLGDADVVAVALDQGAACVGVTFIRDGRNLGTRHFFPRLGSETKPGEVLAGFLSLYYLGKPVPPNIYLSHPVVDKHWLATAFTQQSGHRVTLMDQPRGLRRRWLRLAILNAKDALRRHISERTSLQGRFEALQEALGLDAVPERIECFDVSHTGGEATVAACVAFTPDGPSKTDYRRYNIEGVTPGDDYAALEQAILRRYRRALEEDGSGAGRLPDLLFIDGGKGQVAAAETALADLGLDSLRLIGIAKGEQRKPGKERLFLSGRGVATILPADSPALHLIQQIRDEAHRFAITGHRQRRARARKVSVLEEIPGIGNRRRQALLRHLGGIQEVGRAGIDDLSRVPGISPALAHRIYAALHEGEA